MLVIMTDRGPGSAGFAIYCDDRGGLKFTIQSDRSKIDFAGLDVALAELLGQGVTMRVIGTHAVLSLPAGT